MLWLERRVVDTLVQASEPDHRATITEYVEASLRVMQEPIRAGVAAESLLLGVWPALRNAVGELDHEQLLAQVERWEHSRIGLLRQYVRVLQSLVLFAEHELATGDGFAAQARPIEAVHA
jgi:hypothetical protein